MKALLFLIACFLGSGQVMQQQLVNQPVQSAAGCTAPTMTNRWTAWNASNTCTGGCTNGNPVTVVADLVASNALDNTGTITYTAASLNGYASLLFSGSSYLGSTTLIQNNPATLSFYFIGKVNTSQENDIFGSSGTGSPEYRVDATTAYQTLVQSYTAVVGTGNVAVPNNTYVTIAMTYTVSSGVLNFYTCSAGSCTSAGSATNSISFSGGGGTNRVGTSHSSTDFEGNIVEIGSSTSIMSLSALGAYSLCQYGI